MRDAFSIAMVGFGGIGRVHALGYRSIPVIYPERVPRPHLHTVVTSRRETAGRARIEGGFDHDTTDLSAVLNDPGIDAVDVTVPNGMHLPVVRDALAAGKHVYCEKPLAGSVVDARAIADLVAAAPEGTRFGMVFQYRFFPAIRRARALVEDGRIGRVYSYRAEYLHTGYQDPDRPLSWRMRDEEGFAGALGDLGSHVIDLVRYLVGEFSAVQGHVETFVPQRPVSRGSTEFGAVTVDDAAWIRARMENGAFGTIEVSRFATGTADTLRLWVYGERGALHFDLMDPGHLWFFDQQAPGGESGGDRGWTRIESMGAFPGAVTPVPRAPIGWARSHLENQYQFIRAVAEGRDPSPGIEDGLRVQLVLDATMRSANAGDIWQDVAVP